MDLKYNEHQNCVALFYNLEISGHSLRIGDFQSLISIVMMGLKYNDHQNCIALFHNLEISGQSQRIGDFQ